MKTNTHHTVVKGDVAVAAVVFDLTKRGYIVSTPRGYWANIRRNIDH